MRLVHAPFGRPGAKYPVTVEVDNQPAGVVYLLGLYRRPEPRDAEERAALQTESGAVKLLSHDPAWRTLTALHFHYQTQPLPTPLAWRMQQLPGGFQEASVAVMFVIELAAPFLIFGPRRVRFFAGLSIACLQALILLTGNYTYFNWLAIALCDAQAGKTGSALEHGAPKDG